MAKRKQIFFYKTVARYFDVITQKKPALCPKEVFIRSLQEEPLFTKVWQ